MPTLPDFDEPEGGVMDRMRDIASETVRIAQKPSSVPNGFIVALFVVIVLLVLVR